jgi:hypothetical protein
MQDLLEDQPEEVTHDLTTQKTAKAITSLTYRLAVVEEL